MYVEIKGNLDKLLVEEATKSIAKSLKSHRITLPENFTEILFESSTPHTDAVPIINSIDFARIGEVEKVAILLTATKAVHDAWMEFHIWKFPDSPYRYKWMPFDLLGIKEVEQMSDLYVLPVMSLLLIIPDAFRVRSVYTQEQTKYLSANDITDAMKLTDFLTKTGVYCPIDGEYQQAVVFDRLAASAIARQLIAINNYPFV